MSDGMEPPSAPPRQTGGFAWALGRTLGPPYRGPALIGVFGISSCIPNGLLPCDIAR